MIYQRAHDRMNQILFWDDGVGITTFNFNFGLVILVVLFFWVICVMKAIEPLAECELWFASKRNVLPKRKKKPNKPLNSSAWEKWYLFGCSCVELVRAPAFNLLITVSMFENNVAF